MKATKKEVTMAKKQAEKIENSKKMLFEVDFII